MQMVDRQVRRTLQQGLDDWLARCESLPRVIRIDADVTHGAHEGLEE
jgi:hypothetical protein